MPKLFAGVLTAALLSFANLAQASVITHNTGTFSAAFGTLTGYSYADFDRAEFWFASEYVDTITIANAGNGLAHSHNGGEQILVEVFNGTSWVNVFTAPTGSLSYLRDVFANPITFQGMNISGLRLDSNLWVDQHYHGIQANMTYTLSGTAQDVPEPVSLALFGIAAAAACAARRRVTTVA